MPFARIPQTQRKRRYVGVAAASAWRAWRKVKRDSFHRADLEIAQAFPAIRAVVPHGCSVVVKSLQLPPDTRMTSLVTTVRNAWEVAQRNRSVALLSRAEVDDPEVGASLRCCVEPDRLAVERCSRRVVVGELGLPRLDARRVLACARDAAPALKTSGAAAPAQTAAAPAAGTGEPPLDRLDGHRLAHRRRTPDVGGAGAVGAADLEDVPDGVRAAQLRQAAAAAAGHDVARHDGAERRSGRLRQKGSVRLRWRWACSPSAWAAGGTTARRTRWKPGTERRAHRRRRRPTSAAERPLVAAALRRRRRRGRRSGRRRSSRIR